MYHCKSGHHLIFRYDWHKKRIAESIFSKQLIFVFRTFTEQSLATFFSLNIGFRGGRNVQSVLSTIYTQMVLGGDCSVFGRQLLDLQLTGCLWRVSRNARNHHVCTSSYEFLLSFRFCAENDPVSQCRFPKGLAIEIQIL